MYSERVRHPSNVVTLSSDLSTLALDPMLAPNYNLALGSQLASEKITVIVAEIKNVEQTPRNSCTTPNLLILNDRAPDGGIQAWLVLFGVS